ncbi:hypothetical protein C8R45DRAFT_1070239 [Mycena sanguinolenta]|nr:hypothetical protein C8R45DRAFT_1070239 [Mycena sanguinolenta]
MCGFTVLLSGLGLLPYAYILVRDISTRSFSSTWMYPMLRVFGSAIAITTIQLIIQLRILAVVHHTLTVHVASHLFKKERRMPPAFWDANMRSPDCLRKVQDDIKNFHSKRDTNEFGYLREDVNDPQSRIDERFTGINSFTSFPPNTIGIRDGQSVLQIFIGVALRISLVVGIAATGVGYVGSFKIVQAASSNTGPLVWLIIEVVLSILRVGIWAANPTTDDPPPPIAILERGKPKHVIGWTLRVETVVQDLHAIVIDIPHVPEDLNTHDASRSLMFEYLTQALGVPEDQVRLLRGSEDQSIAEALLSLAANTDIVVGSPIMIYLSHHGGKTRPQRIGGDDDDARAMPYSTFFNLVRLVSQKKGENIVVILDTNFPHLELDVAAGLEMHPLVVLAACSEGETAQLNEDGKTGLFTEFVVKALKSPNPEKMSYQTLVTRVEALRRKLETRLLLEQGTSYASVEPLYPQWIPKPQIWRSLGTLKDKLVFNGILASGGDAGNAGDYLITTVLGKSGSDDPLGHQEKLAHDAV